MKALMRLPNYGKDTTDLKDGLPVLMIKPADIPSKAKGNNGKHHIMNEALATTPSGLPDVSVIATTPAPLT